jgi:hypothetical protein
MERDTVNFIAGILLGECRFRATVIGSLIWIEMAKVSITQSVMQKLTFAVPPYPSPHNMQYRHIFSEVTA